ncbi:MAG: DUF3048 domain-containing protein, partial [Myxococcales bacterium]
MSSSPSRPMKRALSTTLALGLALSLAACGGSDKKSGDDATGPQNTADGKKLVGMWPLTGLPANQAAPKHPVMVVKIDNTSSAQPQIGLSKADLVTEELVEGGITRLAVAFYSKIPKVVGPVRSMRASDIGIVKPTQGVLVASGAAGQTIGRLNKEKVKFFSEGGPGYFREGSRSAPYNLMVNLPETAKAVRKRAVVPPAYLPFQADSEWKGVTPASKISVQMSRSHTTNWEYRGGKYHNINTHAADGDHFEADTVLVLRVKIGDAGYLDPANNPVPETIYKGKGNAMVFHKGQL